MSFQPRKNSPEYAKMYSDMIMHPDRSRVKTVPIAEVGYTQIFDCEGGVEISDRIKDSMYSSSGNWSGLPYVVTRIEDISNSLSKRDITYSVAIEKLKKFIDRASNETTARHDMNFYKSKIDNLISMFDQTPERPRELVATEDGRYLRFAIHNRE